MALTGGALVPVLANASSDERSTGGQVSSEGVWRTDGYGGLITVRDGKLREYQTTSVSCLPGTVARQTGQTGQAGQAGQTGKVGNAEAVAGGAGGDARKYLTPDGRALTLRTNGDQPDSARLHYAGSPGYRKLERVSELPAECSRKGSDDPVATFDTFWHSFAENYPFFAAKDVDWRELRERYRPRVDKDTTDEELFAIFRRMLEPLNDAHVSLTDGGDRFFGETRPGTTMPTEQLDTKVKKYVERTALHGEELTEYAQGRIGYADLPDGRGYLRVSGFIGYADVPEGEDQYAAQSAALDGVLDRILTRKRVEGMRGLILDLRVNGGGADGLGLQLASRLTDRGHFAYAKRARNAPEDPSRFTEAQEQYVRPAPGVPRYTGPIAVLTGGSTVSAGESFVQALMERPGRTVRIGQSTQGVFSDVLERALPNGWRVSLPNEEFRTRDGRTFDGTGVPPHHAEPVLTDEEFEQGRDSAFDRALRVLGQRG
ncbi:protease [Streptomyces oceani]|uniref:Protease n=2 Tax=Streptomyces oceani TaxID=1075402 RepID=A0A1E7JXA9_9ACTN|nr:S41 family peptidase [Streptomyces oceani]OEU96291.1 protease [Streptomyces oceani]